MVRLAVLVTVGVVSCARFDATETIELVPDTTWSQGEVETLRHAARCWKLQFGIPFDVVETPTTAQSVRVAFSDFVCWTALGRFTPGEPAQISLCPLARWQEGTVKTPPELRLFTVLDHELGHAAGIRSEASDRDAVMGRGESIARLPYSSLPSLAFEQEDGDILHDEVAATAAPACAGRVVMVNDAETGAACGCQLDVLAQSRHAMAYDEARGVTILFSGLMRYDTPEGSRVALDDRTWSWNGTHWTDVTPAVSPPARTGAAMVHDSRRQRIVLFGGSDDHFDGFGDTWEWDGTTWIQMTPAQSPPARGGPGMAYDPVRERVVMFGGYFAAREDAGDTWEYDGTTWTERTPASSPPPRGPAAMAFDPVRRSVMMFGGYDGEYLGDQWEWDGVTWQQVVPSTGPGPRVGSAAVSDVARGRITLFGGSRLGDYYGDLWEWDGTSWLAVGTPPGPAPRRDHQLALDTARGRLVLVGGEWPYTVPDTWEWDGTRWQGFGYQQCGNNVLEIGETCDDGGMTPGDGCDEMCQVE